MSGFEKKSKDKLDDEIKLAGLEALVLEELEKHLILNSIRLQTFEDATVTYVEAKFGLMIRDSKPSDTGSRGHSDPMDVGAVNSLSRQAEEKGHQVRATGECGRAHFQRDCNASKSTNPLARANRGRHGPRVRAKDRVQKTRENREECPKEPKVRSKTGLQGLDKTRDKFGNSGICTNMSH